MTDSKPGDLNQQGLYLPQPENVNGATCNLPTTITCHTAASADGGSRVSAHYVSFRSIRRQWQSCLSSLAATYLSQGHAHSTFHTVLLHQIVAISVTNIFAAQLLLRADPHAMVYTDGSVIQSNFKEIETTCSKRIRWETTTVTIAVAGIYIPRALVTVNLMSRLNDEASNAAFQLCRNEHTDGVAISIDLGGEGATNTITRAEGAAIWYALREDLGTMIATDSAVVLYQIRNMLHKPATLQHCKDKALIQQTADVIRASTHHIHLQKVKAHTGASQATN
jgi:ribonuclease HI